MMNEAIGEAAEAGGSSGEDRKIFIRPSREHASEIALYGFGMLAFVVVVGWVCGWRGSWGEFASFLGFCAFCLALFLVLSIQRVVIEGSAVRLMGTPTRYRWRSFDVSEVSGVRFVRGGHGQVAQSLEISLVPSAHRSWKTLVLTSSNTHTKYYAGIDVPLFVAFMRAVSRVQPALVVEGLPDDYAGALPAPSRAPRFAGSAPGAPAPPADVTSVSVKPRRKKGGKGKR